MSRGLGILQRKILAAIEPDKLLSLLQIAAKTHGPTVTASEYETIRRAVHALEKRELIGETWWRMFFAPLPPKRYGLPATIERGEEVFVQFMERRERNRLESGATQHIEKPLTVGAAPHPTLRLEGPAP